MNKPRYLIDVNLPYKFSYWNSPLFVHVREFSPVWKDSKVWEYAIEHNLTVITKDVDFSNRALNEPNTVKVIHLKCGNVSLKGLHSFLSGRWENVMELSQSNYLVTVYQNELTTVR